VTIFIQDKFAHGENNMNLGIYIKSLTDEQQVNNIASCVNDGLQNKKLKDASIFYDNIGKVNTNINCGLFNSTDVWNFSGKLLTTSIETLTTAMKIVNNIDFYYYFGVEKEENLDIFKLLRVTQKHKIKVICNSEDDEKKLYRITGVNPLGISNNFIGIIDLLNECNNERCKNCKNVCRAE